VRNQVFRAVAVGAVEQLLGLLGGEAEPDEAVTRQKPRIVAAGDHDRVVGGGGADLLAQLDDDPLGGALADALDGLQPCGVAGRDRGEQLARGAAGRTASATFGPTDWTPISSRKRSRSASVAKP